MTVSFMGTVGGRSLPQSKNGLCTTDRGTCRALSSSLRDVRVAEVVAEAGLAPVDLAVDGLGVGVEEQLGRVAAQAGTRFPRAVDPEPVAGARPDAGQVGVPAESVDLGEGDALLGGVAGGAARDRPGSQRQSSTVSATSLNTEKLVPLPS